MNNFGGLDESASSLWGTTGSYERGSGGMTSKRTNCSSENNKCGSIKVRFATIALFKSELECFFLWRKSKEQQRRLLFMEKTFSLFSQLTLAWVWFTSCLCWQHLLWLIWLEWQKDGLSNHLLSIFWCPFSSSYYEWLPRCFCVTSQAL